LLPFFLQLLLQDSDGPLPSINTGLVLDGGDEGLTIDGW
jgi:hypothetical protein